MLFRSVFSDRNLENFQNSFKVSINPSFGLLSLDPYVKSSKKYLDNPRSKFEGLGIKGLRKLFLLLFLHFEYSVLVFALIF